MKAFFKKNYYLIALGIIFIFAFFLRFFRLAEIPNVVEIDEGALGYNAWCLAHFGVDRYFNQFPVYPQNFSYGGQSPLYTYLTVFLIKTIGGGNVSLFIVRLPGLIFSMLVVIAGSKSMSIIFQNRKVTLMSALLLTVCPYFIMHGRFAHDCNLMLGCSTVALMFLTKYVRSRKLRDLVVCGIAFGIIMYSYALSYFVVPSFLILITLYMLYTRKITFPRSLIFAVCVIITALPILLFIFSLLFQWEPFTFLGMSISPVASSRIGEVVSDNFFEKIGHIIKISLTYASLPLDAVEKFYTMYAASIPFIVIGFLFSLKDLVLSLKKRSFHFSVIYLLFCICGLVTIGFIRADYIYRINYIFICYLYFLVYGIYSVCHFVRVYQRAFIGVLGACYLIWSLSFFRYYFGVYSVAGSYTYPNSYYFIPAADIVSYAENNLDVQDIYIDTIGVEEYHCFFFPISPYEKAKLQHADGYGRSHFTVNYYTPIDTNDAYIVRRENRDFINELNLSGLAYETVEYPHYYLFYFQ